MVSIRRATIDDITNIQNCNLWNLPENYTTKYYVYHFISWPQVIYLAEDNNDKVVGYVLAKIDDEADDGKDVKIKVGHITSISVLRTHRKLGIAGLLMDYAHQDMAEVFDCDHCSLHVRESNRAALGLYRDRLQYIIYDIEVKYYADGEDAYSMHKYFKGNAPKTTPWDAIKHNYFKN